MITVSAPGSIIIMGEHAVLHQQPAIVCAINKRIRVKLTSRTDQYIEVYSTFGYLKTTLNAFTKHENYRFIRAILMQFKKMCETGLTVHIETDSLSHHQGLGSSGALTVALISALYQLNRQTISSDNLFKEAYHIVKTVQGVSSGIDIAASVYGGLLHYQCQPLAIKPLPHFSLPLALYYIGYKTSTQHVLEHIQPIQTCLPYLLIDLYALMGQCTQIAQAAILKKDLKKLGLCFNFYHGLLDTLGVNDQLISQLIYTLRQQSTLYGVKISGSGLGDCVLALGQKKAISTLKNQYIPIDIEFSGVQYEK
ncbi:MAG: mevalonate kinase [Endozoicomonadaceae bacterium]|nr:mevalonate kinase [Endozoicomonadaceae bacterium]